VASRPAHRIRFAARLIAMPSARLSFAVLALAGGACVGPNYGRPDEPLPPDWRPPSSIADSVKPFFDSLAAARRADSSALQHMGGTTISRSLSDSIANIRWFDLLQDSVLQTLVTIALAENKDLKIALSTIDEFRSEVTIAKGPFYPQVSVNGLGGANRVPVLSGPHASYNVLNATVDLQWELDFWGRIRRGSEAAQADLLTQEENERAVILTLVSDVATAYLTLRELDENLAISRSTLASRNETYRLALDRYGQGVISELDVRQFESDVAGAAASVADFERQVAQQEHLLSILLGRNPAGIPRGRRLTDVVADIPVPVGLPSTLLDRRPDVRASEAALHAATARIGQAEAARFPKFTITGQYGYQATNLSDLFQTNGQIYQAFLGVSIPIFTGGQLKGAEDVQRARAEQALYVYERTLIGALREVEDALTALRTAHDQLVAQVTQVNALHGAERLASLRYQNGVSSYLEVLDAQRNLFAAQLALTQAELLQLAAAVQLYKALGGGWPTNAPWDSTQTTDSTRRP